MANIYVSPAIDVSGLLASFTRADIELRGIDHAGASFEGRVFLNNANAGPETPMTDADGYAGSFFIFGHGGCFGDAGHCDLRMPREYDPRPAHPMWPIDKTVIATEAVRRALAAGTSLTVTVVPLPCGDADDDLFRFSDLEIVAYE